MAEEKCSSRFMERLHNPHDNGNIFKDLQPGLGISGGIDTSLFFQSRGWEFITYSLSVLFIDICAPRATTPD